MRVPRTELLVHDIQPHRQEADDIEFPVSGTLGLVVTDEGT